jgi:hypothetical protein
MTQARVVLRDTALQRSEQLLQVTNLGSFSELINVLISRYGSHLEQTWEVRPMAPSLTVPEQPPEAFFQPPEQKNFTFEEPLSGI